MRRRSIPATVIATGCLVTAMASGITIARAGGNQLHVCVAKSDGAVRIAGSCTSHESREIWRVKGARGAKGTAGLSGTPVKFYYDEAGDPSLPVLVKDFGDWTLSVNCVPSSQLAFDLTVAQRPGVAGNGVAEFEEATSDNDASPSNQASAQVPLTGQTAGTIISTAVPPGTGRRYIGTVWVRTHSGVVGQVDYSVYLDPSAATTKCAIAGIATP